METEARRSDRTECELCPRMTLMGNRDGLCSGCRQRLAGMRHDPVMVQGRLVAAELGLDDELSEDLVAFMLGTAAAEGRLGDDLATAAGLENGAFDCPTCGLPHFLEADAAACCSALGQPEVEAGEDDQAEQPADHPPDGYQPLVWSQAASI